MGKISKMINKFLNKGSTSMKKKAAPPKLKAPQSSVKKKESPKKELTLKFPGATADLMATKNLFDVFIKAKVLDMAGRPD